jgi:hypothetical protein
MADISIAFSSSITYSYIMNLYTKKFNWRCPKSWDPQSKSDGCFVGSPMTEEPPPSMYYTDILIL